MQKTNRTLLKNIKLQDGFAFFNCTNIRLKYKEIFQFCSVQWKSFQKACYMAKNARKTRSWKTNIMIDW